MIKVNNTSRIGIIDGFLVQLTIFYQANPYFGAKLNINVAILTINTCVYGCRLVVNLSKVITSSYARFMKAGVGIIYGFPVFSIKPIPILEEN